MSYKLLRERHLVQLELVDLGGSSAGQRGGCEHRGSLHDGQPTLMYQVSDSG